MFEAICLQMFSLLQVILITEFHDKMDQRYVHVKAKVSTLLHSHCQDKTADGNNHTIFKYKYS